MFYEKDEKKKRAQIHIRIEENLKEQAESVMKEWEVTPTSVINAMYKYIAESGELPGFVSMPRGDIRNPEQEILEMQISRGIDAVRMNAFISDSEFVQVYLHETKEERQERNKHRKWEVYIAETAIKDYQGIVDYYKGNREDIRLRNVERVLKMRLRSYRRQGNITGRLRGEPFRNVRWPKAVDQDKMEVSFFGMIGYVVFVLVERGEKRIWILRILRAGGEMFEATRVLAGWPKEIQWQPFKL